MIRKDLVALVLLVSSGALLRGESFGDISKMFSVEEVLKEIYNPENITREFIYEQGIEYGSGYWEKLKTGAFDVAGKTGLEWRDYLETIGGIYEEFLSNLKDPIANKTRDYSLKIATPHKGGFWMENTPHSVVRWDSKSDLEDVGMSGIIYGYNDEPVSRETIIHEGGHGLFSIYGAYASEETRLIDLEQFRIDTERFMHDPSARSYWTEKFKHDWGVSETSLSSQRIAELKRMFPGEYKEGDRINTDCGERFASLLELYYFVDGVLPGYIIRHFEPFFSQEFVDTRMELPNFISSR